MRKVYILPNLFTAASLLCGMLAIFEVFNDQPVQACWLLVLSGVLDVCDGAVARLTHSTSDFGLQFDSLADLVAFGVAPSLLAYNAFSATYPRMAAAVCGLFTVCGALRLGRYNVQVTHEEKKAFTGLPIPAAAGAAFTIAWFYTQHPAAEEILPMAKIYPPAMVILAYLMVSKITYKGLKSLSLTDRQPFEILVSMVIVGCLLFVVYHHADVLFLMIGWVYALGGLLLGTIKWIREPAEEPQTAAQQNHSSSPSSTSGSHAGQGR